MAKKPDLQPGEYGIKVEYYSRGKKCLWVGEKFSSIEEAEEYIDWKGVGYGSENCTGVAIVDWTGKTVGGFCL